MSDPIDSTTSGQGPLSTYVRQLEQELDRLRSISAAEMMIENLNVKHHIEALEERCLKAERELAAADEKLAALQNSECDKILAMTDEQVAGLVAQSGHHPDDSAVIGKQCAELAVLKRELAAVKAERDGLRADAERLEAIASGEVVVAISSNGHAARLAVSNGLDANSWHVAPSLRTAIDAARKEGE